MVAMLSRDFLKPVLLANAIAWPVAYWMMSRWLEHFAYRTDLSAWVFVWSSLLVCTVAAASVSVQAIQTARANPVVALRYE